MSSAKISVPQFEWTFLAPKHWPTWLAVLILYCISWLPYVLQWHIGKGLGWTLSKLAKKRVRVAERNLELCFPDMLPADRDKMLKAHIQRAGMAILEAGMGWWWPDWRVAKHSRIEGLEYVEAIRSRGKGVLGLAIHNMTLELGCRILGSEFPCVGFYRPHNNPVMEYFQYHGRSRANKYMISKRKSGGLISALNDGELCLYLPDQDYGRRGSEFVPFFAVADTATTTATMMFAARANCETAFLVSMYDEKGYVVKILPGLEHFPSGDSKADTSRINQKIEEMVMLAPEQYLWMHKRFKTRPQEGDESLYQ